MKLKSFILGGLAALFAFAAFAQSVPVPSALPLGQADLVQVIKNGQPSAQSQYAPVGAVAGALSYAYAAPLTGATIALASGQSFAILQPAAGIAAATVTLPANPSDGQDACIVSTQVITTLTVTPASGQALVGAPTATTVANVAQCWIFRAANASWYRYQ